MNTCETCKYWTKSWRYPGGTPLCHHHTPFTFTDKQDYCAYWEETSESEHDRKVKQERDELWNKIQDGEIKVGQVVYLDGMQYVLVRNWNTKWLCKIGSKIGQELY